jgi:hypothetical protein
MPVPAFGPRMVCNAWIIGADIVPDMERRL